MYFIPIHVASSHCLVGVSAYAGAAQYITNPAYLTAAAVVLSTEARHASWVAAAVNHVQPWSGPLDVSAYICRSGLS